MKSFRNYLTEIQTIIQYHISDDDLEDSIGDIDAKGISFFGKLDDTFEIRQVEPKILNPGKQAVFLGVYDTKQNKIACFLELYQYNKLNTSKFHAYTAFSVSVDPKYANRNIALRLYAYLILQKGWTLVSDKSQTEFGGKLLWEKLSKHPNIHVYAYDEQFRKFFPADEHDVYSYTGTTDHIRDLVKLEKELKDEIEIAKKEGKEYRHFEKDLLSVQKELEHDTTTNNRTKKVNIVLVATRNFK